MTHVRRATIPRDDFETIGGRNVFHDVPKSGQALYSRRYPKNIVTNKNELLKGNYSYWNVDTALGVNLLPPRMNPSTRVPSEKQASKRPTNFRYYTQRGTFATIVFDFSVEINKSFTRFALSRHSFGLNPPDSALFHLNFGTLFCARLLIYRVKSSVVRAALLLIIPDGCGYAWPAHGRRGVRVQAHAHCRPMAFGIMPPCPAASAHHS